MLKLAALAAALTLASVTAHAQSLLITPYEHSQVDQGAGYSMSPNAAQNTAGWWQQNDPNRYNGAAPSSAPSYTYYPQAHMYLPAGSPPPSWTAPAPDDDE